MPPAATKSKLAILSIEVMVRVKRSLTLVSFDRFHYLSMHAKYDVSISYGSKVMAKVKVFCNGQTGQKLDALIPSHGLNKMSYHKTQAYQTLVHCYIPSVERLWVSARSRNAAPNQLRGRLSISSGHSEESLLLWGPIRTRHGRSYCLLRGKFLVACPLVRRLLK